jgi:tRNA G10  N-methylase Trm11
MSGSGTLLAERLLAGRARIAVGLDSDERALAAAVANLAAAGVAAYLVRADVRRPPLDGGTFDAICADLPYGWRSGSHAENADLYHALLAAAAGVAAPGARLAVITHDIRRFEAALAEFPQWRVDRTLRVFQKGYRPRIWLLHN